ncbi:Translocase of chloroplast 159, chloroplastic [Dendrobium catenatum]|uniref:Translocase of chloroplast 159, chloroplastic n=1 Tax=Dendrobium catenatum TaxID=906689 RepID=A0A2I0WEL0_9ASPA|nr:Translocase of chloroplast 159, chloroplastic [Dendrobium catenatum]
MFGLSMEPRHDSSAFPLAIRARLSTEDSASDASSFFAGDSDDNSGIEESGEEDDEDTKADNVAFLRRPSMPIARVTEDDVDDDVLQELLFEDDDNEEEEVVEEGDVNPKLAVVKLVEESLNAEVDEGFAFGREESGLFDGNEVKDNSLGDDGPANVSEDELLVREEEKGNVEEVERMIAPIVDTVADEGGLELNDVKEEMDGSKVEDDMGFSPVVCEKIGAVGYGNANKGFKLELKNLVVESSIIDSEKSNFAGDIDSAQNSVMEVVPRALRSEADHANMVIPEVEGNPIEIVKIEASGAVTSNQHWNDEAEPKSAEAEFGVWEDLEEVASDAIDPKNYFFGEKTLDTSEAEAHSNEFKGFEAIKAVGFSHSQILEMSSLHGSEASEPKHPEVCAVNMEAEKDKYLCENVNSVVSEKGKDSSGKLLISTGSENSHGSSSPSKDVSAQFLENFNEKNDESRAFVKEVFITENYNACESYSDNLPSSFYAYEKEMESKFNSFLVAHHDNSAEEDDHVISEWPASLAISENTESVKHILKEMEDNSSLSHSDFETLQSYSHSLDGQTISNSDKEGETDEDGSAKELFDTSALAALLRASNAAFSGRAAHLTSQDTSSMNDINDEENTLYLKLEQIWAKYLCLVEKLGYSANDALPDHVLYRMGLINRARCGRTIGEEFRPEIAKKLALKLDEGKDDFSFSCTILVIGKTGVGKSAAINSIFGEERAFTDPFKAATTSVREISGVVDGVHIRFIDTPGLLTSMNDQGANRRILSAIKKYTGRCPPDVVLYVDRLDAYNRDFNELPMLRMITNVLGSSIWFNAIIALTHGSSVSPDGSDGSSSSYEGFVLQRSKVVQQLIRHATEDTSLVNLVALVDSDPSCRRNIDGESILPNGLKWRPWLLLLCYSSKILSELNSLVKLEIPSPKKLFPFQWPYPLPVFLSSLLHSKVQGVDIDLENMTKEVLDYDNELD